MGYFGANTILCCMSLKWEIMKEKIDEMNAYNAYARIEECIGIDSNSTSSIQLKKNCLKSILLRE